MTSRSNIFDIANEAGVSIATVSRVMSGQPNVRPVTKDKVLAVARKHGYRPNLLATGLAQRKHKAIGVVLPLIDNPFYSKLYIKIHQEAEALGYTVTLFQIRRGSYSLNAMMDDLIGLRLSGIILSGDTMNEDSYSQDSELVAELSQNMPVVLINTPLPTSLPCLSTSLAEGARLAVRHLNRLGHKRIALLGGINTPTYENTREYGYLDEMRRLGLEEYIYPFSAGESLFEGSMCITRMLSTYSKDKLPTAIFAFNDLVAMGAMRQLQKEGYRLPEDMAIVGCDNQPVSAYLNPALTTIDLHIEEIGCAAVNLLINTDRQQETGFSQSIQPTLIIRESCGA